MIDELDIDHKVGFLEIDIISSNPLNEEIIRMVANRYHNIYRFDVYDHNDLVNDMIHEPIK